MRIAKSVKANVSQRSHCWKAIADVFGLFSILLQGLGLDSDPAIWVAFVLLAQIMTTYLTSVEYVLWYVLSYMQQVL